MLIIPVLDICGGIVVHAKQGARDNYQPITSLLTKQTDAEAVLSAYYSLYPFKTIYIADLDAIQGKEDNHEIIKLLASKYPDCEFWLDTGINGFNKYYSIAIKNIKLVLGSENKVSKEKIKALLNKDPNIILSLDFALSGFIENNFLLEDTDLWPHQVIVMMLHRVGLNNGPDLQCINNILDLNKNSDVYIAGGIKNIDDLKKLKPSGIKGALIASALHNGSITKEDLVNFYN